MVNLENYLLMYECFFFHLNLLAVKIVLFLLYVSLKPLVTKNAPMKSAGAKDPMYHCFIFHLNLLAAQIITFILPLCILYLV